MDSALQRPRGRELVGARGRRAVGRRLRQPALAITLLVALMVQYTIKTRWILHWVFWTNFGVTVVATLYFGWHYIADDIAGVDDRAGLLLPRRASPAARSSTGTARELHGCNSRTRFGEH
jgi:hypothetical protein